MTVRFLVDDFIFASKRRLVRLDYMTFGVVVHQYNPPIRPQNAEGELHCRVYIDKYDIYINCNNQILEQYL